MSLLARCPGPAHTFILHSPIVVVVVLALINPVSSAAGSAPPAMGERLLWKRRHTEVRRKRRPSATSDIVLLHGHGWDPLARQADPCRGQLRFVFRCRVCQVWRHAACSPPARRFKSRNCRRKNATTGTTSPSAPILPIRNCRLKEHAFRLLGPELRACPEGPLTPNRPADRPS